MGLLRRIGLPKPAALLRDALLWADRVTPAAGVPVLCYHKIADGAAVERHPLAVSRERFEAHMTSLAAAGYRTVAAGDALAGAASGSRVFALTFDDGHADALEIAAPVLARLGFAATVFPVTGWIGREGWLDHRTGNCLATPRDPADLPTRFLTWKELRALQAMGWSIGAHTCTHPALLDMTPGERRRELTESRRELEARLETTVDLFCYPCRSYGPGPAGDVRAAGYRLAFSLEPGLNGPGVEPMNARRAAVRGWHDLRDVQLRLTGQYPRFRRIADVVERRAEPPRPDGRTAIRRAAGEAP
jgi:peptidoglycan/xylan/chitin deacetylase (PgdA/CDA1 family)